MLIPINDEMWVNPNNITTVNQSGTKVIISFIGKGDSIILDDSKMDDIAKWLNSQNG